MGPDEIDGFSHFLENILNAPLNYL